MKAHAMAAWALARLTVLMLAALAAPWAAATTEFLDPLLAFKLKARALDDRRIELHFEVAKGYYLYRERFGVSAEPAAQALGELQMPAGKKKHDLAFQRDMEVFHESVTLVLPLAAAPAAPFRLTVANQGCADAGLCYPPTERRFEVTPAAAAGGLLTVRALAEDLAAGGGPATAGAATAGAATAAAIAGALRPPGAAAAPAATPVATAAATPDVTGQFDNALQSRNLFTVAGVFLLGGLLLAFTPCVLPMLPILSAIIVGQSGPARGAPGVCTGTGTGTTGTTSTTTSVSRRKGFALALTYSMGMALVYTAFGMAAGLMGAGLAATLQNAWVLGGFALLLAALSLSMFGVYELQMPASLQTRLSQASGRLQGGKWLGVFAMGGLSALIVGPCVAAPLAGALVYISQSRDVWLGGLALFSLAVGMSVPLLLIGASAGSLLPRAGHWMERVKYVFGVLLLAVALWMVAPVLPAWALMGLAALLLLGCAVALGAFERLLHQTPARVASKGLGLALAVLALLQLVGAASGGRELLQPLRHLGAGGGVGTGVASSGHRAELNFTPIHNLAALQAAVAASSRPVMLDFYADWCVSCKEFEAFTLTDDAVRQRLAGFTLLRADVTANNAEHQALLKQHKLFGPPALLFFAPGGAEHTRVRVIGFMNARDFLAQLDKLPQS